MRESLSISLDPAFAWPVLGILAVTAVLVCSLGIWRRARGAWWRVAAALLVLLALSNPTLIEEQRAPLDDIVLLVVDDSTSQEVAGRVALTAEAAAAIEAELRATPGLDVRIARVDSLGAASGDEGTRLMTAVERALADAPRSRVAGVIALTDGQIHDVPAAEALAAAPGPFHALITGSPGERDRRIEIVESAGFGMVDRDQTITVRIDDPGAEGAIANLTVRHDGGEARTIPAPVGQPFDITVTIDHAGSNVFEIEVEPGERELTLINNRVVAEINGVRDRLRVLLVSGEPHAGERTWRRLLKADPAVDLVHFTILRQPEKDDLTPLNELALIAFPVRELFQVKLREFDLIVFDRFANRGILPPAYLRNIADYVRSGGALLMSVGPEFAGPSSLAHTPLAAVLPARPEAGAGASGVVEGAFRPHVTALGARHPVTERLTGANPDENSEARWGRWYRSMRADLREGTTVMQAAGGAPLLVLGRVGEGRVALLLSDHIWLWSRGHDGGGPQAELLRRTAHWLMREPELEEEDLSAHVESGRLTVQRQSLEAGPPPEVTVTAPDGRTSRHRLEPAGGGRSTLELPAEQPGVWQVSDGQRTAFAAAAAVNPLEVADLRADAATLQPILEATGGAQRWLGDGPDPSLPDLRRIWPGRDTYGSGWIGLRRNGDHTVTGIAALPLLPPWLALPLVLGIAVLAWRREGR